MATSMNRCPFDAFGSIVPMTSIPNMEKGHSVDKKFLTLSHMFTTIIFHCHLEITSS